MRAQKICALFLAFAVSAAMLTVIQPPFNCSWLAWAAYVPLILISATKLKFRHLMTASYVVSAVYWLVNLYWIGPVTAAGWIAFCLYTALLWPILISGLRYCSAKKIPFLIAAPVLIVGTENMQGLFLGGFAWRLLAHSQYENTALIQIADIFGAAGVSFLIAMVNGVAADLVISAKNGSIFKAGNLAKISVVCALLGGAFLYGNRRIRQSAEFIHTGPVVSSIQSNIPQSVKQSSREADWIFEQLLQKGAQAAQAGAEIIVFPETMVQAVLNQDVLELLGNSHSYNIFDKNLRQLAGQGIYVLAGAYGGRAAVQEDSSIELVARYNSAFLYRPDGSKAKKQYSKIHLVPFGEFIPFRKSCRPLYRLLMKFTPYDYDYSLDAGSEYTVFEMKRNEHNYRFGVLICYEDVVPLIARKFAVDNAGRKRLDWLVNISNDGWFVKFKDEKVLPTTELSQHTIACVFRAVENRVGILRSVNTGISCLVDTLGRVRNDFLAGNLPKQAMARQGMAGWFVDKMPIDERVTFFSRHGQWLDNLCTSGVVLSLAAVFLQWFYHRRKFSKKER